MHVQRQRPTAQELDVLCASRERCVNAATPLDCRMSSLLAHMESLKPRLASPERVRKNFDPYVPEWDRWRSLFLIPESSYQRSMRPVRR